MSLDTYDLSNAHAGSTHLQPGLAEVDIFHLVGRLGLGHCRTGSVYDLIRSCTGSVYDTIWGYWETLYIALVEFSRAGSTDSGGGKGGGDHMI